MVQHPRAGPRSAARAARPQLALGEFSPHVNHAALLSNAAGWLLVAGWRYSPTLDSSHTKQRQGRPKSASFVKMRIVVIGTRDRLHANQANQTPPPTPPVPLTY